MIPLKMNKRAAKLGLAIAVEDNIIYLVRMEDKTLVFGGTMNELAEELSALEEAIYDNDEGK